MADIRMSPVQIWEGGLKVGPTGARPPAVPARQSRALGSPSGKSRLLASAYPIPTTFESVVTAVCDSARPSSVAPVLRTIPE